MAIQNNSALATLINLVINDNSVGDITAAELRQVLVNLNESKVSRINGFTHTIVDVSGNLDLNFSGEYSKTFRSISNIIGAKDIAISNYMDIAFCKYFFYAEAGATLAWTQGALRGRYDANWADAGAVWTAPRDGYYLAIIDYPGGGLWVEIKEF